MGDGYDIDTVLGEEQIVKFETLIYIRFMKGADCGQRRSVPVDKPFGLDCQPIAIGNGHTCSRYRTSSDQQL